MSALKIEENVSLAAYTTLGVGGPARWFCRAHSEREIEEAVGFARERGVPLFVLGGGSNLLVSDAGFAGLVLRVALRGRRVTPEPAGTVLLEAAAGEDWDPLVRFAVDEGLGGIECLAGIPGDAGGTPVQNVGAYGQEVADTITSVRGFHLERRAWAELSREECGFAYRRSIFNSTERGQWIVTAVRYRLVAGGQAVLRYADLQRHFAGRSPTLREVYEGVREIRARKGMLAHQGGEDGQSAGSFFKNPIVGEDVVGKIAVSLGIAVTQVPHWPAGDAQVKLPAAWLIERAGFARGYALGRAGISTRHTLALVNRGGATAADLIELRDAIIRRVQDRFGVVLEQEPVLLGF